MIRVIVMLMNFFYKILKLHIERVIKLHYNSTALFKVTTEGVKTVAIEELAPRRWEYESFLRRSAIAHITTTTNTLQSLIKLLGK